MVWLIETSGQTPRLKYRLHLGAVQGVKAKLARVALRNIHGLDIEILHEAVRKCQPQFCTLSINKLATLSRHVLLATPLQGIGHVCLCNRAAMAETHCSSLSPSLEGF